jgi:uncharacterized membrane protein
VVIRRLPRGHSAPLTLDEQVAEANTVVTFRAARGTHHDERGNQPATGRSSTTIGGLSQVEAAELSVVINQPTDEVFTYLADLENDAQWRREWVEAW